MQELVKHLVDKGHHRIAFISGPADLMIQQERFAGYLQGLEAAGLQIDPAMVVEGDLTEEGGYRAAIDLLNRQPRPTAIVGCNDLTRSGHAGAKNAGVCCTELAIAGLRRH